MNPLEQRVKALEDKFKSLQSSTTIPYDIDGAFRKRFASSIGLVASSKGANSEDVTINEAGSASKDVLGDPVGFLEVMVGGSIRYIPYY